MTLVAACVAAGCSGQALTIDGLAAGASSGSGGSRAGGNKATSSGDKASGGSGSPTARGGMATGAEPAIDGGAPARGGANSVGGAEGSSALPVDGLICDGGSPSLVAGWKTEPTLDYVALRLQTGIEELGPPMIQQESGEACAGAGDLELCQAALAATLPDVTFNRSAQLRAEYHFAYTVGDAAGTIGTMADLKNVLGAIDTGNEAAAVLWAAGRNVSCDGLMVDEGGYLAPSTKQLADCPVTYQPVEVRVSHDGIVSEIEVGPQVVTSVCAGRRPPGFRARAGREGAGPAGECLAQIAQLELASVEAFARLEEELRALAAPAELVQRCRAAAADEVRHARAVARLALAYGAKLGAVVAEARAPRSLLELALENAREGAVRELYGAAVAAWQAQHAGDARVRAVFSTIARDEAEHAALAFDLASWLESQLHAAGRARVEAEKLRSWRELRAELGTSRPAEVERLLGMPGRAEALALLDALEREPLAA